MNQETKIPKHVGLILDGNRRWAKDNGKPTLQGHKAGFENLSTISEYLHEQGVEFVSAYIFSTENWSRTKDEVGYLMNLGLTMIKKEMDKALERGVRIVAIGDQTDDRIPEKLKELIEEAEDKTKDGSKGTLALCFNYGGHRELANAAKAMIKEGLQPDDIDDETIASYLYHPEVPPVDFLIRTSGEQRISNFMLYRVSYAELYFTDKHWPAITKTDIDEALDEYASRHRRFGGN